MIKKSFWDKLKRFRALLLAVPVIPFLFGAQQCDERPAIDHIVIRHSHPYVTPAGVQKVPKYVEILIFEELHSDKVIELFQWYRRNYFQCDHGKFTVFIEEGVNHVEYAKFDIWSGFDIEFIKNPDKPKEPPQTEQTEQNEQ